MKKIKIIANPSSGREGAVEIINKLLVPFASKGTSILLNFTQEAGDARKFAATDDGEDCIISMGGDGTVNEVVSGLYDAKRDTPLAIYPAGTVNDFAESLGIPKDPYDFYTMVVYGKKSAVDIGLCGDSAFINVCAVGAFSEIGYSVPEEAKSAVGRLAYYAEGFRMFRERDFLKSGFDVHIDCDGEIIDTKAMIVMVSNSNSVGGFSKISPKADVKDGLLELAVIEEMSMTKVFELFRTIGLGKHIDHDHFIYRHGKKITLRADKPMHVDIDGEKGPCLPQTIQVVPGAVQLITK
ncbi:diacylglycerol/lipid kinase family protein [Aedoeadaptatus pacaensis]|uniref:diacylglycerol/lipid kinase family protein n=1 Tax=Aedoeadaptatus pacaensis TaxID=1776390 RepID=UPI0008389C90|nr:diacylglycerol kinase family protein [Peptoniphilus pacaensis]